MIKQGAFMFLRKGKKRSISGLSMLDYSILIITLTAALMVMQAVLRRTLCFHWKSSADSIGGGRQYDRSATTITYF